MASGSEDKSRTSELIDTLWNVNTVGIGRNAATENGINRYIMECKYILAGYAIADAAGINRYIMECK